MRYAGQTCPECGVGTIVERNLCEHHYYWDSDVADWAEHIELCGTESIALWWECNHCLRRWPVASASETLASLEDLKDAVKATKGGAA